MNFTLDIFTNASYNIINEYSGTKNLYDNYTAVFFAYQLLFPEFK